MLLNFLTVQNPYQIVGRDLPQTFSFEVLTEKKLFSLVEVANLTAIWTSQKCWVSTCACIACLYLFKELWEEKTEQYAVLPLIAMGQRYLWKLSPLSVVQIMACTLTGAYPEWLETHTKLAWFRKVQPVASEEPKRIGLQYYFRCKINCSQAQAPFSMETGSN